MDEDECSTSSTKSYDAGDGSLGECLRQTFKLIFIEVCKICSRKHVKFKRHEIFEDFKNKMTSAFFVSS